jgi:hypothetical protein
MSPKWSLLFRMCNKLFVSIFISLTWGSKHIWNVGQFLPDYTAQHPRRQSSSYSSRENLRSCINLKYGSYPFSLSATPGVNWCRPGKCQLRPQKRVLEGADSLRRQW